MAKHDVTSRIADCAEEVDEFPLKTSGSLLPALLVWLVDIICLLVSIGLVVLVPVGLVILVSVGLVTLVSVGLVMGGRLVGAGIPPWSGLFGPMPCGRFLSSTSPL